MYASSTYSILLFDYLPRILLKKPITPAAAADTPNPTGPNLDPYETMPGIKDEETPLPEFSFPLDNTFGTFLVFSMV